MKTCTCSIRNHDGSTSHVPLARCNETGLLLLCLSTNSTSVDLTIGASTPRRDGSAVFHLPCGISNCTCATLGVSATLITARTVRAQAGGKKS